MGNSIRGHLKVYGNKFAKKAGKTFRHKIETSIQGFHPRVQKALVSLLNVLDGIDREIKVLNKEIEQMASQDEDVQLLQTFDGVCPITALAFKAELDDPKRFENSKDVAADIGLTPKPVFIWRNSEKKRNSSSLRE